MNKDKQRIAIATACGIPAEVPHWRYSFTAHGERYNKETHERWRMEEACARFGCSAEGFSDINPDLPNYLNDLNAMHEAEKVLLLRQQADYHWLLEEVTDSKEFLQVHATAAQRAEAFLRTLGKWEASS
jgi:EAL domain-containing protein (putative c-di-GMP-specific phosphodiesterase class I)